jgi:hypothetical protein
MNQILPSNANVSYAFVMKSIAHSSSTQKREFYGEDKAAPLVEWLNSAGEPDASNQDAVETSKAQITQILDWLRELGTARTDEVERCVELTVRINELLAACPIIPYVWLVPGREMAAALDLAPAPSTAHDAELRMREAGRPFLPFGGHHHLMLVIDLWRGELIHKLRRCKQCRKWLYSRFGHQEFCSVECREAEKFSPEYKKRRNAIVRTNRHDERARDQRNRERDRKKC